MSATKLDPRTPVIVGVGQVTQRPKSSTEPGELGPIELAAEALRRAADDAGGDGLLTRIDSARHVASTCGMFTDEAALIAAAVGASPRETVRTSRFGGDSPQRLVGDTASAILRGELDVATITGTEAFASLRAGQRGGEMPAWGQTDGSPGPTRTLGDERPASSEAEVAVGLTFPIYNYALLESALGSEPAAVAELWARFSAVAATNPHAWDRTPHSAQEIATPTVGRGATNRPIAAPYTKLHVSNIGVDQASALILCSVQAAEDAGVPRDRWVFPVASAWAYDEWFMTERRELAASPAIRAVGGAVLAHAGAGIDDVALLDIYSCFPSAVQIAAAELGTGLDRDLTVTGGLAFAGGPANNYVGHSIATMVARLREQPEELGLVTAVGWYLTKHAHGVYSATPPARPFAEIAAEVERPAPRESTAAFTGSAPLEAFTVAYANDGTPEAAVISALTDDGRRALARTGDRPTIDALLDGEADDIDFGALAPAREAVR